MVPFWVWMRSLRAAGTVLQVVLTHVVGNRRAVPKQIDMPPSFGGLGLFSAERVSSAAYWAAWADALPVLRARYPEVADGLVHDNELEGEPARPCLRAAALAAHRLAEAGWEARPDWDACARGAGRPAVDGELGLGNPGWQRHAVLALHTSFRERVLLPTLTPAARALLHSQSGPHAGMWLAAIPSDVASIPSRPTSCTWH